MSTLINTLMQNIKDKLQSSVTAVNGRVFRHRVTNLTREDLPALNLIMEKEATTFSGQSIVHRELTLKVQAHTRGDSCETDALDIMQAVIANLVKENFQETIHLISQGDGELEHADADSPACLYSKQFKIFVSGDIEQL
jgi:hypothetical protein